MTSPQYIREWLIKMEYSDPYPSEESLQILCKGPMGPIFQQIIDKVKPKAEVLHVKKSILVNRLINDNTNVYNDSDDILEMITYNEKRKLEKDLTELNGRNLEKEANLQHLISKLKSKNIKLQLLRQKIQETEKDIVLFKAKCTSLDKQIEVCRKLLEQLNILQYNTFEEDLSDKFYSTLAEIEQAVYKFDQQLTPPAEDLLGPISEEPFNSYLQTSIILSSNKKPLSISKRLKRANSTRKNIFDISYNFSLLSSASTIQKKNLSKISVHSFNNTSLSSCSSNETISSTNKYTESLKGLEYNSWINLAIQKHVAEMWQFGPDYVLKSLYGLKIRHKKKLIDLIAESSTKVNDITTNIKANFTCGLEKLYAHHIQSELKRMKSEQQQKKIAEMLETNLDDSIPSIIILQVTEFGLQNSVSHLRQIIATMQQDFFDNTDKVEEVLKEIKTTQTEVESTKLKLETNLCLLYACNAWLNKIQKQVLGNIKEPHSYSESQLLLTNTVEKDVQIFLSCPFQQNNIHNFDSWNQIYNNPQLREIFQYPFLSPESSVHLHLNQKRWLNYLKSIEKTENEFNLIKFPIVLHNNEVLNNNFKKSLENLKQAEDKCRETLSSLNDFNLELKYNLSAPLNDCVAQNTLYQDKKLKEYVEMYDEYYNKL